jgi:hypothetical protein
MSKAQIKSLLERIKAAAEGHRHLDPETKIKREDARQVAAILAELVNTKTLEVQNG